MTRIERLRELLTDPLRDDTWAAIARRLGDDPARGLGMLLPRAVIDDADPDGSPPDPSAILMLRTGATAAARLAADANATLIPEEEAGLEMLATIIGRPALPVIGGKCAIAPPQWSFLLDNADVVDARAASVGRIDFPPGKHQGTGFLVGDRVVMTNRHVANAMVDPAHAGVDPPQLRTDLEVVVDFDRELGGGSRAFRVEEILVISRDSRIDLALLRVAPRDASGHPLPPPLAIRPEAPQKISRHLVYAIGYPGKDNSGDTPAGVIEAIFAGGMSVKRVQPGFLLELDGLDDRRVRHDCSTLGGSSGSCVVDLETGLVCGLHYGGSFLRFNSAVALWRLPGDAAFAQAFATHVNLG